MNICKVTPCLLLLFIAIYPYLDEVQSASENEMGTLATLIKNFFFLLSNSFSFVGEDITAAINEELKDITPDDQAVYDFVVVGAGTAGAAVASRLSEEKNVKVLLIEAGVQENAFVDIPLLAMYLQSTEDFNWNYKLERSPNYCRGFLNGQCNMPRGKVMGGCSTLNFMLVTRGHHLDYDNWASQGCDGWSWQDVYPIFKQMENFDIEDRDDPTIEWDYHSTGGLVNIARARYRTKASKAFLDAGVERGFKLIDYDGKEMIGYNYMYTTHKNGSRCSSNRAYLHPARNRPNLYLSRESHAEKILIDNETRRAYGVVFKKNGKRIRVVAKKEVIVCAGAIGSPQLLMLSGIGPREHLEKHGINVIKDLPVGYNLMDHMAYWGLNFLINDTVTILTESIFQPNNTALRDYTFRRQGPLTIPGSVEAASFFKTYDLSSREGIPDMELIFSCISIGSDPIAHEALSLISKHYDVYLSSLRNKYSFMIMPVLLRPKSRGRLMLRSSDPYVKPKIYPNYFDHPDDMKSMIIGIRESIRLTQTEALKKYDPRLPDNPIPGCEDFENDSDEFWDCAVRTFADTLYHPAGTCKMGARSDRTAVVDPRLKVIGIKGLRVADASVMPIIIAGHTMIPTMMIGEKLAMMVKQDWKMT